MSKQPINKKRTADFKVQALKPSLAPVSLAPSQVAEETHIPTSADTKAKETFEPTSYTASVAPNPNEPFVFSETPTSGDLKSSQPNNYQQPSFKTAQPSGGILTNFPSNENFPSPANNTNFTTSLPTFKHKNNGDSSNFYKWDQKSIIGTIIGSFGAFGALLYVIDFFFPSIRARIRRRGRPIVEENSPMSDESFAAYGKVIDKDVFVVNPMTSELLTGAMNDSKSEKEKKLNHSSGSNFSTKKIKKNRRIVARVQKKSPISNESFNAYGEVGDEDAFVENPMTLKIATEATNDVNREEEKKEDNSPSSNFLMKNQQKVDTSTNNHGRRRSKAL